MNKIFFYGTLKKGFSNHRMLAGQKFLSEARTLPKYKLYRTKSFPCMVKETDGVSVQGELWEVDDECLQRLDWFEGHPDLFRREAVEIENETGVEAYVFQEHKRHLKEIGDCWNER
jgi:gamma-glutamylaminecyclotransferase